MKEKTTGQYINLKKNKANNICICQ